jgi:adenine-specific DNA-methyltransferase
VHLPRPPYGIKFNSNFQWSTTSRDVKDGNAAHITREPEPVKAFPDTWRDGIHSYLTSLRDRLTVARDLLAGVGFGVRADRGRESRFVRWYARDFDRLKYRPLFASRDISGEGTGRFTLAQVNVGTRVPIAELGRAATPDELTAPDPLQSASLGRDKGEGAASWFPVNLAGKVFRPTMPSRWKTNEEGMDRLMRADRLIRRARHLTLHLAAVVARQDAHESGQPARARPAGGTSLDEHVTCSPRRRPSARTGAWRVADSASTGRTSTKT